MKGAAKSDTVLPHVCIATRCRSRARGYAPLLRRDTGVEVPAVRRRPGEGPTHALFVGQKLGQRRTRHRHQRDIMVGKVDGKAIEAICDHRARRAAGLVVEPEHEVIDKKLRTPVKQVPQRLAARLGVERVALVDADPGQALAQPGDVVALRRVRSFSAASKSRRASSHCSRVARPPEDADRRRVRSTSSRCHRV
jgi:hypothetical protein